MLLDKNEEEHFPHLDELMRDRRESQSAHIRLNLYCTFSFHFPWAFLGTDSHNIILINLWKALLWHLAEGSLVNSSHVPSHTEKLKIVRSLSSFYWLFCFFFWISGVRFIITETQQLGKLVLSVYRFKDKLYAGCIIKF